MTAPPDGARGALREGGCSVALYTLATGKRVALQLPPEMAKARGGIACAFSPDNKLVAVSAGGVRFHTLHDAATGKEVRRLKYPAGRAAFAPDGKTLYLAFGRGAEGDRPGVVALDTR